LKSDKLVPKNSFFTVCAHLRFVKRPSLAKRLFYIEVVFTRCQKKIHFSFCKRETYLIAMETAIIRGFFFAYEKNPRLDRGKTFSTEQKPRGTPRDRVKT